MNEEAIDWVQKKFDTLSIEEKIGQLFCPNIILFARKKKLDDILQFKPGGVFLHMSLGNLHRKKVKYLQEHSKIPLLVAGDLELGGFGGMLNGTFFNTQMGVGATNDDVHAYRNGLVAAREGVTCGYNWTYSPVVDINYNHQNPIVNIRAYGDNPELVARMAKAYIKGIQENGMAACAKHWPGDGMDDRDQHLVSTINSLSMDEWRKTYGKVYSDVINAGVKTIMSAHIGLPSYHSNQGKSIPGVISEKLNVELLRKELGFNGLIVSDAVSMGGLLSQGPKNEVLPKTIESGCDMILFSDERENDYNLLLESVENGVITRERLDEAVMRILALKASLNLHKTVQLSPKKKKKQALKNKVHVQWSNDCIKSSITLVKDTQALLPINSQKYKNVLLIRNGDYGFITRYFKKFLRKNKFSVDSYKGGLRNIFNQYDLIIFLINISGGWLKNCLRMVDLCRDSSMMRSVQNEVPTLFISLANPYHLYEIPTMKTVINCYNPIKRTQKILMDMLLGKLPIVGKSPVDAFCGLKDSKP